MAQRVREGKSGFLERIDTAERAGLQSLDLSNCGITAFPDSLSRLKSLRVLDLSHNQIGTVSFESLSGLSNLQDLDLRDNRLAIIPNDISCLTNLHSLSFANNQITEVPDAVSHLLGLQTLSLANNQLTAIPAALSCLSNLREFHLANNRIAEIPELFSRLANLQLLDFSHNELRVIPDWLEKLKNMRVLDLSFNQIRAIPNSLSRLANLQSLDLSANVIKSIPISLSRLANLQSLSLSDNEITTIPSALARLTSLQSFSLAGNALSDELVAAAERGKAALFRYLESTKHGSHPRTVKLVLLGEPQSGKTTLLEALKGNPRPCDPQRKETLGVNVATVNKRHPRDGQPMHLSVWDFAGQHMEHATHQFSLTKNAIFLLLWNARQGADFGRRDLWYWLELLKMRVGEPKLLLVATHTELTPPDLNLTEVKSLYQGCEGQFPVEFETLVGFSHLENKILEMAAASPAMNAPWPPNWLPVRDAIRTIREATPHVTPAEFGQLMENGGVRKEQDQKDLAEQLHQLGEIIYFQDLPNLSGLVILNPTWLAELLALVVRSEQARANCGLLSGIDLDKLWQDFGLSSEIRTHLCRLMDQFDLTYSTIDAGDASMVVEALPYSQPEDRKKITLPANEPRMEMIFRFPTSQRHLPPGIPTWGIARAHRLARPGLGPWRDLAFFEDSDTASRAIVQASDVAKEVRLSVASDYPPFFFGRMEAILRDTFKRYPGLIPEERLPCPCEPGCRHSYNPDYAQTRPAFGIRNEPSGTPRDFR